MFRDAFDIELHIKAMDWFYILLIGMLFGLFLSSFGYILQNQEWMEGAKYGVLLGFCITFLSLIFITNMNKIILPNIEKVYWLPLAILFSFLSGFFGTQLSIYLAQVMHIGLISLFRENILLVSIALGVLSNAFGTLLYQFVKMRNVKEELDYNYVQSRLKSLERQLNPHFLFNALNSIAELIHHDKDKAEMAILQVSSFLRNTMDEKALVPLETELRNVNDYVALENIRFSGKIQFHMPQLLPKWCIPKFSIQLIVENAIKHGLQPSQKTLHIWMECDVKNHKIILKNDGAPMRETVFGIGLNNLNQRLKLLCGGSLKIHALDMPTFYIFVGEKNENLDCR